MLKPLGRGEVIGMRVGFQDPFNVDPRALDALQQLLSRTGRRMPGRRIVIQYRIDDRSGAERWVRHHMTERTGRWIIKGVNEGRQTAHEVIVGSP